MNVLFNSRITYVLRETSLSPVILILKDNTCYSTAITFCVITFCVKKVITFCVNVITFCVSITFCGVTTDISTACPEVTFRVYMLNGLHTTNKINVGQQLVCEQHNNKLGKSW